MSAMTVLLGALVVFLLMRLVVEPKLRPGREIWDRVLGVAPPDAAVLAGVRFVGTFSLFAGLGAAIGIALTWWVESLDAATLGIEHGREVVDQVNWLLRLFGTGGTALSWLGVLVSVVYVVLFAAGLLYWSARSTRQVRMRIKAETEQLEKLGLANELPPLPPDARMRKVDEAIAAARAANAGDGIVEALYTRRFQYDVVRRVDPGLLQAIGDPVPGSRVARVLRFLVSMPLSHQVKKAGRAVSATAMLLIVPAALVITSADLRDALDEKQPELEALAAALTMEVSLDADAPREWPAASKQPDEQQSATTEPHEQDEAVEKQKATDEEPWCEAAGVALAVETCDAAAEFGGAFEAAWGASLLERSGNRAGTAALEGISDARRAWARYEVLLETVERRSSTVQVAQAVKRTTQREDWARTVMDAELDARTRPGPVSRFGKRAAERFGQWAQSLGGRMDVEVADRPLTLTELASRMVSAGAGLSIDGLEAAATEGTPLDKLWSGAVKETLTTQAQEGIKGAETHMHRAADLAGMGTASRMFDTQAARGGPMRIDADALRIVGVFVAPDLARSYKPMIDQATRLAFPGRSGNPAPPGLALEAASAAGVDLREVENALREYRDATGRVALESQASYSSLFPGIEGQRAGSQEARLAWALDEDSAKVTFGRPPENAGGGGAGAGRAAPKRPQGGADPNPPRGDAGPNPPGGGAGPKPGGDRSGPGTGDKPGLKTIRAVEVTSMAGDRLSLARSYARLGGHPGIRGVLIGREPNTVAEGLDLVGVDFHDDQDGSGLTIHLTHSDGRKSTVGPYDRAVAHLALAYAADGRPATVTMVAARPLADLKILLHPALVDTELGCHAIRLDQFVDRYGLAESSGWHRAAEVVGTHYVVGLYGLAWRARWLAWFDEFDASGLSPPAVKNQHPAAAPEITREESAIERLNDIAPLTANEALPPLRQRPDLFDPELVDIMETCLSGPEVKEGVGPAQCIDRRAREAGAKLTVPPPIWHRVPLIKPTSGVRETAYELDEDLAFAQVPRDIWDEPLRFVALNHIEMVSYSEDGLRVEPVEDSEPWQFEALQPLLEDTVLKAVRVDPHALETLRVMQQFTVAQRLFRAAFDGQLGETFPTERLAVLARQTAEDVDFNAITTDRWLLRGAPLSSENVQALVAARRLREALSVPAVQQPTCLGR